MTNDTALTELVELGNVAHNTILDAAKIVKALHEKTVALSDELEKCKKQLRVLEVLNDDWMDKTEWIQEAFSAGNLPCGMAGMHRADIARNLIDESKLVNLQGLIYRALS